MITAAIVFFSLSSLLGLSLLLYVLKKKHPPKAMVFLDLPLSFTGMFLLSIYCAQNDPRPVESLILMLTATIIGVILVTRDLTGKSIPKWLAVSHGLIALAGFVALLMFKFS